MGRMADLLRNGDHRADNTDEPVILSVEPLPVADAEEDVPFIEVGGPRPVSGAVPPTPTPATALGRGGFGIRFMPFAVGKLPGRGLTPELVAFHQPDHSVSVQYRSLVAEVVTQLPGSNPRVLMLVGSAAGAGTTTVMLNLAVTLAKQDGTRVAVIDANFARPAVAAKLGVAAGPGLREVLARHTPLAWSLQDTAQANLVALSCGKVTTPVEDFTLAPHVEQLRPRYDWVLIDAGVWGDDASQITDGCDAVYLILPQSDAAKPEVAALQTAILESTGRLRGSVLTHC